MDALPMKIQVKLYASLSDRMPDGVPPHEGALLDLPGDTSPHALIDQLDVPRELAHLILLNGVYVNPEDRDKPVLRDGDVVAVWPPIAGG
ncbi:molybdopterin converting factor small subunit [Alkalispirillum mobile]|uniref:Molybdopterin converting factor small subunit n=1 Tax=Alkalispirillum mobile TaxID=85925 RepID=A0A498C405_9GAMM|nr:MoaD/ThiS family protein [Alkalispirillum mobile]RLK50262.1 molybdopterin converting factor small subunit [Alkalispirillum mobile]